MPMIDQNHHRLNAITYVYRYRNEPHNKKRQSVPLQTTLKLMYANVRGIKGKRSSIIEHLNSENPHLMMLTETLLPTNNGIVIDGYKFFGRARSNKKGGGVGILVNNNIISQVTTHISERQIEIMWVSIRRKNLKPLFVGCYYGRQESRCNKDEITIEMNTLSEEIEEYKNEGDVLIFMDGNGKIGLLGKEKSRNGILLEKVFQDHNLEIINKSEKCQGKEPR